MLLPAEGSSGIIVLCFTYITWWTLLTPGVQNLPYIKPTIHKKTYDAMGGVVQNLHIRNLNSYFVRKKAAGVGFFFRS